MAHWMTSTASWNVDRFSWNMDRFLLLQFFLLVVTPGLESFPSKLQAWEKCFTDPDYEELVHVAKHGLEKGCHSKKVVIVGAGISGLTAAKLLRDAGCKAASLQKPSSFLLRKGSDPVSVLRARLSDQATQVLIVEASDHVGGRIMTYHDMDKGWYVDLGPMRLPRHHRIVREFITKFKLKLNPFYNAVDNTWYLVHNIRARAGDVKRKPDILQYPVHPTERGKSASELYGQTLDKVTTNCRVLKEKYDSFSTKEYLIKEGNLSRGAINMIGDLLNEDGKFQMSFLNSVMDHVAFSEKSYDEITGGFDQLPDTFYQNITREVQFHSTVVKILNGEDQVRVFYRRPDTLVPLSVTADYVLITATAKAMQHIKFSPPLSTNKTHALRSIHYLEATKIILACTEKFWEKDGIHGGRSITDRPSRFIYYPSHNFSSGVGVILASYTWGNDAEFFIPLNDEKSVEVVLEDLAEIHQLPKNYIQKVCDKHVVKKWSLDTYSMGAYISLTPYQFIDYSEALFQNEGRVHFAGEHTAQPHAWIDTAMKSAVRAARNIHGAINTSLRQLQQVLKENKI